MEQTALFELGEGLGVLIFEMAWKSTVVLGSVILLGKLLNRRSALLTQIIYSTGVLTMLCLLAAAPFAPRWTINSPVKFSVFNEEKALSNQTAIEPARRNSPSAERGAGFSDGSNINQTAGNLISLTLTVFPFIWLSIALLLLGKLAVNLFRLKNLRRSSRMHTDERVDFLADEAADKFGFGKRSVKILRHESIEMPVTWGVFRHFILLPDDFEKLPVENRRQILIHESAHIKRFDFINRIFAEVLCAVLWFQPLVWTVRKEIKEAQERAADDCVLEMGEKPSGYARLLLETNNRLAGKGFPLVPGVIGQPSLKSRLEAILDPETRRRPATIAEISVVLLLILGLSAPLIGLRLSREAENAAEPNWFEAPNFSNEFRNESKPPEPKAQANVSKAKAVEIATGFQPGTVVETEFGQTDEGLVYKILIRDKDAKRGNITRLTINALDGRIIKTWRGFSRK